MAHTFYTFKATVLRVVDGDTYDILLQMGFNMTKTERFRLSNIDTPETWRPSCDAELDHGIKAKNFVKNLIEGKDVILISKKSSASIYGRYECDIIFGEDGKDLAEMIRKNNFCKLSNYDDYTYDK